MAGPIKLTRNQLAAVFPDPEMVRQFESVLIAANDISVIQATANIALIDANAAQTSANAAQTTASAAQSSADAAQLDVNNLTVFVRSNQVLSWLSIS